MTETAGRGDRASLPGRSIRRNPAHLPDLRQLEVTCTEVSELPSPGSAVNFRCGSGGSGCGPRGVRPVVLAYCDNTGEPLAVLLLTGPPGSNTAADHLAVLDAAIAALPPGFRRRLVVTCDGAGASHDLITRLDALAARRGYQLTYSVGWELGARERAAIGAVPASAWQIAIDACGEIRERRADDAAATRAAGTVGAGSKKPTSPS